MKEFVEQLKAFYAERQWEQFHSPKNLAINISIEASEILEHFLWLSEQDSYNLKETTLEEVKDEIGDVLICLLNLSSKLGIDPLEAAKKKLEKIGKKYPVEKSRGKCLKYTAYVENPQ